LEKKDRPKTGGTVVINSVGVIISRCVGNHFLCVQKEEKREEEEAENKFGKTLDSSSQTNVYMIYSFSLAGGRALVVNGWY